MKKLAPLIILLSFFRPVASAQITITLKGNAHVTIPIYDNYSDPGATAFDANGVDYTPLITRDVGNLNLNALGTYTIKYQVTDSSNHTATAERVIAVKCFDQPSFFILGPNPSTTTYEDYKDPLFKINGGCCLDTNAKVISNAKDVLKPIPGMYPITYTLTDSCGNTTVMKRYIFIIASTATGEATDVGRTIDVYPNPSKGIINIDLKTKESVITIRVYNLTGALVKEIINPDQSKQSNCQVDLTNEKEALYFIRLEGKDQTYTAKVLLQK